jgi:16S rRNA processing protein RimM
MRDFTMGGKPSGASAPAEVLPFGILGRPHGTTGEISLHPFHAGGCRLDTVPLPLAAAIGDTASEAPAKITAVRRVADGFLLRLEGVLTREQATSLTGRDLCLAKSMLPPLSPGEFYVEDLVDCRVEDREGRVLGVVRSVFWNGAHDVMVIGSGEGGERLLPAVPEFVVAVDRSTKCVVVDPHE